MATLREVRRRISGVKTTQKITRAMKMVAAAKLRRAQMAVVAARPYAAAMRELLAHLAAQTDVSANALMAPRPVRRIALVTVTSDRGMCGAFNSNLERTVIGHINALTAADNQVQVVLFCIGRKGADFFARRQYTIGARFIGVYSNLVFGEAQAIARQLVEGYLRGDFDQVEIIFNEFKSAAHQRVIIEQFLPVTPAALQSAAAGVPEVNYIYEPAAPEILLALLPKLLNFHIWRILLESNASEEGARMIAMENATENAEDLITTLQLQYNKARQAAITKELLEVVSGAEALGQA